MKDSKLYKEIEFRALMINNPDSRVKKFASILINMESAVKPFYSAAVKAEPEFNAHGMNHSLKILSICGDILQDSLLVSLNNDSSRDNVYRNQQKQKLTVDDIFVLIAAILWHDSAMKYKRKDHAINIYNPEIVQAMTNCISPLITENSIVKFYVDNILLIASSHSCYDKLSRCESFVSIDDTSDRIIIRQKSLAGILRLADELSDHFSRYNEVALENVDVKSKIYWKHSNYIKESNIIINQIHAESIAKICYQIPEKELFCEYEVDNVDTKVSIYHFIINRLDKVHHEMTLCCPLFSELSYISSMQFLISIEKDDGNCFSLDGKLTNELFSADRLPLTRSINETSVIKYNPLFKEEIVKAQLK